jgi:alpha/beta superfamily hydrolase
MRGVSAMQSQRPDSGIQQAHPQKQISMSLKQLVKLYILQKNHHKNLSDPKEKALFENEYEALMAGVEIIKEDRMAPALFEGQPNIPFVLLKPKEADSERPRPLIIHTHGGPHVYMDKDKPHAEIAYFLSQGYVVVCPNYRGSTGPSHDIGGEKGDLDKWLEWVEKSQGKHHIYGPEDVYAVAKHMQQMPYVDKNKFFLRGGSFGSFINSHLLVDVKKGKFEPIFKAAHLSGGVKYPIPTTMPDDIPLLITHSKSDEIAPYSDAQIFMEKILLRQLSYEIEGHALNSVQTYVAQNGDHHLIDPRLQLDDESSVSYDELWRYLELTTGFIDTLCRGDKYQPTDNYEQFKAIMEYKKNASDVAEEVLTPIHTIDSYKQFKASMKHREKSLGVAGEVLKQIHAYDYVQRDDSTGKTEKPHGSMQLSTSPVTENKVSYGPTMALLKLQLGEQFTGDIRTDLVAFLKYYFSPINRKDYIKIKDAGELILSNHLFVEQLIEMIEKEEAFLKQNPTHMVMYHAADNKALQLYSFINLWLSMLKGMPATKLPVIEEMRLYDFMKASFDDIEIFLKKMRRRKMSDSYFNYIPGFPERAIACNPTLISNSYSTSSCSLWWYFDNKDSSGVEAPLGIIKDMLKVLGIYSKQRLARYLQLFEKSEQALLGKPQALMQQIFIPYALADKAAYMCQMWGEEFKANDMTLKSPQVIHALIETPALFEEKLRANTGAFTNFANFEGFGETDKGFNYASVLQIRYLSRKDKDTVTNSYYRSEALHEHFISELSQLIREDYADYLACGNAIPDFVVQGAAKAKSSICSASKLRFFKQTDKISLQAFYLQQYELSRGLVQNPSKEIYGSIIDLDKQTRIKLQERLKKNIGKSRYLLYPYSLCRSLKGYTYYDLLKEAATALFLNDDIPVEDKLSSAENFKFIMRMVDAFSDPASIDKVEISEECYNKLNALMHDELIKHRYNPRMHQFILQHPGIITSNDFREDLSWQKELRAAFETVLRYASLAKDKSNGLDVTEKQMALY